MKVPKRADIEIQEVGIELLGKYAEIPIRYKVESVFDVQIVKNGLGRMRLREEKVSPSYVKDYDADKDEGPTRWPKRFDTSNWGVFLACKEDGYLGGAVVAYNTPGVHMLDGRDDLAVLWDIRVHPDFRRCGIGTKLFSYAVEWTRKRKCRQLKVETQNVNVPACRFYLKQGCRLGAINRYGYFTDPRFRHEVMLLWYLDL